jgi:hypothetical protein
MTSTTSHITLICKTFAVQFSHLSCALDMSRFVGTVAAS